ncbi:MAG: 2-oxo acid dehydrogenase subunit E2 [Caldilineaceae bacterium]|nr:2-oxo acid dehydrogenase subunit E2 [Caldilineaceae bacterium]
MAKEVIMPALGMAQETGTLLNWHKREGEMVNKGELLMTVATDKTDVEIEAPASGLLQGVTLREGEDAPVGQVIAWLLAPGETVPGAAPAATMPAPSKEPPPATTPALATLAATPVAARMAAEHGIDLSQVKATGERIQKEDVLAYLAAHDTAPSSNGKVLASPKARRLATEQGVDLATIHGSGPDGAVIAADVLAAVQDGTAKVAVPVVAPMTPPVTPTVIPTMVAESTPTPGVPVPAAVDVIPMSRPWRIMAQRLQQSWTTVPHFYLERDVNATALGEWRKSLQARSKVKLTYTDLVVKAVAAALRKHPRLNASWLQEQIVANSEINIGLAVAVEDGLLVPVIHAADRLGLSEIASRRLDLVEKAQAGKLPPADLANGTFTISNLGMFGVERFNAIVNPPQSAILAVGALTDRVVPVNGQPAVQPMLTLTLSCDHRSVDGARAAQFLQTLVGYLEDPLRILD